VLEEALLLAMTVACLELRRGRGKRGESWEQDFCSQLRCRKNPAPGGAPATAE